MTERIRTLRDQLVSRAAHYVPEEGWTWSVIEKAAADCHLQDQGAASLFPNGLIDAVAHFSDIVDRAMFDALNDIPYSSLRSKDRIRAAIMARLTYLAPQREVVRQTLAFWTIPTHVIQGQRVIWRTADKMWSWAGDKATDYSRQTKRAMLSSILMGTSMVWITDDSKDIMVTQAFLDRRLENAMEFGKTIGTIKTVIPNLFRQART